MFKIKVRSDHVRIQSAQVLSGPDQGQCQVKVKDRSGISQVLSGQVRTDEVKAIRLRSNQGHVKHGQVGSAQVR